MYVGVVMKVWNLEVPPGRPKNQVHGYEHTHLCSSNKRRRRRNKKMTRPSSSGSTKRTEAAYARTRFDSIVPDARRGQPRPVAGFAMPRKDPPGRGDASITRVHGNSTRPSSSGLTKRAEAAYAGAKFDSNGYCLAHHSIQMCKPTSGA